jgi:hypothetical protein
VKDISPIHSKYGNLKQVEGETGKGMSQTSLNHLWFQPQEVSPLKSKTNINLKTLLFKES